MSESSGLNWNQEPRKKLDFGPFLGAAAVGLCGSRGGGNLQLVEGF